MHPCIIHYKSFGEKSVCLRIEPQICEESPQISSLPFGKPPPGGQGKVSAVQTFTHAGTSCSVHPWFIVIKTFGHTKLQSELYFWNKTQSLVLTQQESTAWGTQQFVAVFSLLPACIMASSKMLGANGANRIKRCVLMWEKAVRELQPAVVYFAGCSCGFCQTFAGMKFGGPASGSNNQQSIKNQSSFYCCKLVPLTFLFSNSCL